MNTEIVAQIIAAELQERPELAGVPVWEPTDAEKEGDKGLLVNATAGDEIVPGNYTYKISGVIMYRQRYAEADPAALALDVTSFSRACAEVMATLAGRRNGQDEPAAWVVLGASTAPAIACTSETFMTYQCDYELYIQF